MAFRPVVFLESSQSGRCSVVAALKSLLDLLEGEPIGFLRLFLQFFPKDQASYQKQRPAPYGDLFDTEIGARVMP